MNRDSASSYPGELTVRLGSAHDDVTEIGMLFFSPSKVRLEVEAPPLTMELPEDLPERAEELSAEQEDEDEPKGRASWLDALWVHEDHGLPPKRDSPYNSDDNGLYRMFLPEAV